MISTELIITAIFVVATILLAPRMYARVLLSRAKHRSLTGHVRMSNRVARLVPSVRYGEERFFAADDAPAEVVAARRSGFERLSSHYRDRCAKSIALGARTRPGLSDMQLTSSYRVPFQFAPIARERLGGGPWLVESEGVTLTDVDGNEYIDLTGSYGVNLLGNDVYKALIAEGAAMVAGLGPVLGLLHPIVAENVERLRALSGQDEVSFHMSGTEAVMQAVRLARYHTGRRKIVRFCGAYHGWWGDVQPGAGNPTPADHTYTLAEMSEASLKALRNRRDVACVLVNPIQAMHPNMAAPSDSMLIEGGRRAAYEPDAYAAWLKRLAETCRERGIVLIFDDIFMGFRLRPGSVGELYGVKPDLITLGKTLGGGLPVGVVCGRSEVMKRFREDRPADLNLARGTFNAHPYVMGSMNAFLRFLDKPETRALYDGLEERWNARAEMLNRRLADAELPVSVANLSTVWTVLYARPTRYNWMLQYYLRDHGLALSWVGTGRLIFSLNFGDAEFGEVADRFVAAVKEMRDDGWFWTAEGQTGKQVRRRVLRELVAARLG